MFHSVGQPSPDPRQDREPRLPASAGVKGLGKWSGGSPAPAARTCAPAATSPSAGNRHRPLYGFGLSPIC